MESRTPARGRSAAAIASLLLLAACGGGGTGGTSAVPQPQVPPTAAPPTPTSTTPAAVVIFTDPVPETYAALGASTTSAGDGYTPISQTARLTDVSLDAANQPALRYTASGSYEIQVPGTAFDRLVHYAGLANPTSTNNFFQPASARQNAATFTVSRSRLDGYLHAERAAWTDAASTRLGFVAFGSPTPASSLPASGSATYGGSLAGLADITFLDNLYGGYFFDSAEGTVTLTVDFAARTVRGTLDVSIAGGRYTVSVPFSSTSFASGADTFRGSFAVPNAGFNEFRTRLAGPAAKELIGSWAVPVTLNGEPHQLMGVWIAKRSP